MQNKQIDDAQLVARVNGGDLDAFEVLIKRHELVVLRTIALVSRTGTTWMPLMLELHRLNLHSHLNAAH